MNSDILTALDVDDKIELLSDGKHNIRHVVAVRVVHYPASSTRDGVQNSVVSVAYAGEWHAIKTYSYKGLVAAECYGHNVADVLGMPLKIDNRQRKS